MAVDRMDKVNHNIQKLLAEAFQKELDLPSGVFLTVSKVSTNRNLSSARVYVSTLPYERSQEMIERLNKLKGLLRSYIAKHFHVKKVPELHFLTEEGFEKTDRVQQLLDKAKGRAVQC